MRDIKALHPKLQCLARQLMKDCEEQGLKIGIGECLRTQEEQDALYAKGRTLPGSIVTNAKGATFSSMHQWGVAFDFYRNDKKGAYENSDGFFEKVGKIGKALGLEWGGDFKSIKDLPHFQLPDWGSGASVLKNLYKTPENFFKTWEEIPMTEQEKIKFNSLVEQVEALTLAQDRVYHYTKELPDWAKPTIQKLMDKGIYAGSSESDLNLPETVMRVLVINDRAGIYN
jgi:hypothetical protein